MADASPTAEQLLADAAWLRRLATALAGNEVDADDLIQESWIAAWRRKPEGDRPLGPWLAKVVRDLAGMRRRGEARRAAREQVADETAVAGGAGAVAAPDALLDRMRLHRLLVDLVLELAEPYRSTIVARFFEGSSAAAIARAHGVPASTVRGRLRDGIARLREQLDAARGERKAWAPVALALARGGAHVAKPTKAIAVIVAAILALLAGAIFFIAKRHAPARARAASPAAAPVIATRDRGGTGTAPAAPSWFAPSGVGPRRVAGRVTFEGTPVAGASVSLHSLLSAAGVAPAERTTGADGRFDFGSIPAGTYDVAATAPERAPAIAHIALDDPTRATDQLELRLGGCAGSVSGSIVDAAGNAIPHATVRQGNLVGVEADARGAYKLCTPRSDSVEVAYGAASYGTVVLTLDVHGEVHRDVVLVPEATLDVRVVRADGAPVPDAMVTAWPAPWAPDHAAEARALAGAGGEAHLGALVPGAYILSAFADGAATASYANVQLVAGPNPSRSLVLAAMTRVHGTVSIAGTPIAGAEITATGAARSSAPAHTHADGSFAIDRVPLGDLVFRVRPYRVVAPVGLRVAAATDYAVSIEVAKLGAIRGRVTRQGEPVAGARVCCMPGTSADGKIPTDADGRYEFLGVPAGTYDLVAASVDAFSTPVKIALADAEERTVDIDLDLGAAIAGTVVDQSGVPVPGVVVRWTDDKTGDTSHCPTDARGAYRCGALSGGGSYRAAVFSEASMQTAFAPAGDAFAAVALANGASEATGVQLAIADRRLSIRGVVRDDTGTPVADARVAALAAPTGSTPAFLPWLRLPTTFTDGDGAYEIDGLVAGAYALRAHAADGADGMAAAAAGDSNAAIAVARPGQIRGTLAGFSAIPRVMARPISTQANDSSMFSGAVDGSTFDVSGLSPGRYVVSAVTRGEGDAQLIDVHAGQVAEVALAAHGTGAIDATVLDVRTQRPIAGAHCQATPERDGELAAILWDVATAPTSDAAGHVTIDPAPAGDTAVMCIVPAADASAPIGIAAVPAGGRAAVQLDSVARDLDPRGN